jgi:two-component system sensor histidine kinase SaeS
MAVVTFVVFAALLGLVLGITALLLRPERSDLLALTVFLLLSGGATLGVSIALARSGLPGWVRSLRTQLLLVSLIISVLVIANIGFTAYLMFLSPHDLTLLVGLILFSLGLSTIASYYLSAPTSRNIQKVIGAARDISTGNLLVETPVDSRDEIGELAVAFNAMARRLKDSLDRERQAERTRRELIEAVSHDLRTPLASVRAIIESINDGVVADEETVRRYLSTAQSEIESLSQLVNDLFELSQIDAGLLKLHTDAVFMQELVSDTVQTMSVQAASHHLSLEADVDGALLPVTVDARRIQRVLYNLVQNAMRHTPPDGSINVRARDAGEEIEVQVADTGEGMPAQDLTKVFERSYSRDRSRSRQLGGTGLGLSIAKSIVEAHGGRIWAESEPGRGSVFSFRLPKMNAASS